MDKELYIGVDVSKKTLDLAYYDGETIDWKNAHLKEFLTPVRDNANY